MSENDLSQFARTSRYFALAMAAIIVGSALLIALVQAQERAERQLLEIAAIHLRSLSIASLVAAELNVVSGEFDRARDADRIGQLIVSPSASRAIESIRGELVELRRLESNTDRPELLPVVQRVWGRFERLEAALASAAAMEPTTGARLDALVPSLSLAVEQMRRLQSIAANSMIESRERLVAGRTRTLVLWGAGIAGGALLAASAVLVLLRRTFEREEAMRAEIEQSRERMLHSQKLEALGTLAGGVAHDFNNLLTVILGHAALLGERPGVDDSLQDGLYAIERAAEHASSLTRQLLAFSRREVGEPRVVDLNEILRTTQKLLRRLVDEDFTLVTRLDPGLVPVCADPSQVEQVIANLVVNARDAMPDGGTVTLETANARLGPGAEPTCDVGEPRYARLSVRDTGCGIPPELRERIFEPFFTTKPPGEGTGLGLSTVHGIASGAGGFVFASEEPAGGTRIDVYFPESEEPAAADERSEPSLPHTGAETILLVEDQPDVRALSAEALRDAGYQVLEAGDGLDALRICREHRSPIELIVTDVVMPNMKGPELVEHAKPMHPEARVLYMSGYTDDALVRGGYFDDPEKLIQKPFRVADFLARVRRSLEMA